MVHSTKEHSGWKGSESTKILFLYVHIIRLNNLSNQYVSNNPCYNRGRGSAWTLLVWPPVYLHSIFEISSVTRIFFNFKISSLKNWKINLISKLIFAGYTGSRNQVQTRKKIKLVLNSIFFQVWNKLRNPKFENRVQRDRANARNAISSVTLAKKVQLVSLQWRNSYIFWRPMSKISKA